MKSKLGIKSRIIISFSIFTVIVVNIFVYLLYIFVSKNFIDNIYKDINFEYQTITTFIDLQKTNIFSLPKNEIQKINSLNFFFYIWNNDKKLMENYKLGFHYSDNQELIFRWDYKWFNIIIWKKISDLKNIQKNFIEMSIFLNIFMIICTIIISYFITLQALKPLSKLSNFLDNYDINKEQKKIINNYWNSEIWIFTNTLNRFISKIKTIFDTQKDFIQDVSHELKTPLMQIESTLDTLENKFKKEDDINKIDNIKESLDNINNIIQKLSFILRWEEFLAKKEKIDLYKYLQELTKNYTEILNQKNINLTINKNFDLILENNIYYLDRLFWNIISNSIFYNKWNNAIIININKDFIEIKDEWIWMEKENLNKIFNRFYRNKNSNLYYKNWSWLWLSIVKKICDMFWWKIIIESTIWLGSSFKIYFV